ncbi:hypothetical protein JK364_39700 [Streptomyces sp. 110]|uniref:Uncharacterized protein n=1 Tax=Streptomyces endocoffeicus TaxID=2898945 RepID=A0ABS1Q2N0_9ACTN|nr:hypothetical protein [Streptomyces endocoffeicus]MBL1118447.1 hypothetical protein [Streptomyces endocoffeicus]
MAQCERAAREREGVIFSLEHTAEYHLAMRLRLRQRQLREQSRSGAPARSAW